MGAVSRWIICSLGGRVASADCCPLASFSYVPIQTDFSDLWTTMAFFAGDNLGQGAHDDLAKEIAMAGKDWAEKHWFVVLALNLCILGLLTRRALFSIGAGWIWKSTCIVCCSRYVSVAGAVRFSPQGCAPATDN